MDIEPPQAAAGRGLTSALTQAQQALDALVAALEGGPRSATSALAGAVAPSSCSAACDDNAAALRVEDLSMRYVDDAARRSSASQRADLGPGAWSGTVQLCLPVRRLRPAAPRGSDTDVVFVPDGGAGSKGARIAGFGRSEARTPLWLEDRLSVVRTARTLVSVAGATAGRYPVLVARAVRQVARTLPSWRGPLLVEVPRTREQLDDALDSRSGEYDDIAAVTTTADGSLSPGAPVRVFLNPDVFGRLKQRGAQVVMSHEATHVATGATFVTMPTWLLEGFADFVALDGAGVPVRVAAAQILERIKADGLPEGLPTSEDLDPTATGLGATYEEAWLACRFLAQEHGAARLVRFYETVSDGTPVGRAFTQVLGTSQTAFVSRWRADLADLAGVAG